MSTATKSELERLQQEIDRARARGKLNGLGSYDQGVYRGLVLAAAILGVEEVTR